MSGDAQADGASRRQPLADRLRELVQAATVDAGTRDEREWAGPAAAGHAATDGAKIREPLQCGTGIRNRDGERFRLCPLLALAEKLDGGGVVKRSGEAVYRLGGEGDELAFCQ